LTTNMVPWSAIAKPTHAPAWRRRSDQVQPPRRKLSSRSRDQAVWTAADRS